jgi:hypothetical protein
MLSTSHLTVAPTSETKINENHSNFNLRTLPCDVSSNFLYLSTSPTKNSKYLYYVNAEPTKKQSIARTATTPSTVPSNNSRKLSTISLSVPWYRRSRSPTDDKSSHKSSKMSRDRLLPLDKLFNTRTHSPTDDEQVSPINDSTPLDETIKLNEKNMRQIQENGCVNNSSHLMTR